MRKSLQTQTDYIDKIKKASEVTAKSILNLELACLPNVYKGGTDSELVIEKMIVNKGDSVLDLCCGNGVIALAAAKRGARLVIGTDLNPQAIKNAKLNKKRFGLKNVEFTKADLFGGLKEKFDVITINPPYTDKKAKDLTEICFWDEGNKVTRNFFANFREYLKKNGRVYFAWAEFADQKLLAGLARENNCSIKLLGSKVGRTGFRFDVFKIVPK